MTEGRSLSLGDMLLRLTEENPTKSRDYGRGYAQAIRDAYALLWTHDGSYLREDCECFPPIVDDYRSDAEAAMTPASTPGRCSWTVGSSTQR